MAELCHIYVFGDQTYDYSKELRRLLHSTSDPLLISFFEKAYYALRVEIGSLPIHQRQEFDRFSNFSELVALSLNGNLHPALDQALCCAYQLASFISRYSQDRAYPKATSSYVIGLCTGALAAAAVCSSSTFSNLLPAAVQSVVVAFRTGLCTLDISRTICSNSTTNEWSLLCSGITLVEAQETIKAFSEASRLPLTSQPYISACSDYAVTISGPPGALQNLRKSQFLDKISTAPLPIRVPYHAPHLYSRDDIESVLSTTSSDQWAAQFAGISTMSGATGKFIGAGTFRSLLYAAVEDILSNQLRLDKLSQRLGTIADSLRGVPVVMHQIGVSADRALRAAVTKRDIDAPLVLDLDQKAEAFDKKPVTTGRPEKSNIAIIGASGRFPDAQDMKEFWDLLYEGRDVVKEAPPLHWDVKTHVDPTGKRKNTSATPYGCWLDHPDLFDAKFFNISPREAPQIDPAQRLALLTAYEAIEEAGIVPGATPSTQKDRVGVFYGVTSNDWMETNSAQNIDTYFIPGGNRAFIPGRINYFFKFSGPSYSVDTACSSSLASIHVACNALWRGEIDTAIAGGTNVLTNPDFTAGLDRGHFLSRTGNCKTFDDSADGYCRGEGVATIILKRLEDAIADNDPIQAVILGGYTNHSAEAESITRPFDGAQKDIFRKVLSGAGVNPYDVGYVEMHGTGTQAGDNCEMRSVLSTFAPDSARVKRSSEQDLFVGSTKANIGHGEASSGVMSLQKVLLMMKHNMIPPHAGIKTKINHSFPTNMAERRVFIANKPVEWKRPQDGARKAFVNNFSAAGGNTALLIEDAPILPVEESIDHRSNHVVAVSAKGANSLHANVASLISLIDGLTNEELGQLSYTTTARRIHHAHRVMVYGKTLNDIKTKLQAAFDNKVGSSRPKSAPRITFAFTGQGASIPGMAKQLYDQVSSFRSDINRFDLTARNLGFESFRPFLTSEGSDASQYSPLITQLATLCLEMALARLWKSWGVFPDAVMGHSLGEYVALNISGVLSDSDTIYLVGKRAQLLQNHCRPGSHAMLAVRSPVQEVEAALAGKSYEVACINGPMEIVLSGSLEDIKGLQQVLAAKKYKSTILNLPYAFHSAQVDPILSELEEVAKGITFNTPTVPILSTLHGRVIREAGVFGPKYLSDHCRKAVDMLGAIRAGEQDGAISKTPLFVEVGPHPVLTPLIKSTCPNAQSLASLKRNVDSWEMLTQALSSLYTAGADITWRDYHRDFKSSHKVLKMPAYNWDLKSYWMQYVNDWSLRKGDPPLIQNGAGSDEAEKNVTLPPTTKTAMQTPTMPVLPRLESTTIHKIIEDNEKSLILESDISRPDLNPMVQGHKVNGVPLCTPSVYADIGLSIGEYLRKRYWPEVKNHGVDVSHMVIEKALIAAPKGPQLLRTIVDLDSKARVAKCRFVSVDNHGKSKGQHAKCEIRYADPTELQNLKSKAPSTRTRIAELREGLKTGKTYVFNKAMVYKMVATLAQFDPNYRAIDEIVLDSAAREASSIANFADIKQDGTFHTNPAYIDALSQSGGFVMNANDDANLELEVFVNHGWESFQLYEQLDPKKRYQTHVAMKEGTNNIWKGDCLILDDDKVVAFFGNIELQGVPKRLLHYILSTESAAQTGVKGPQDAKSSKATPATQAAVPKKSTLPPAAAPPPAPVAASQTAPVAAGPVAPAPKAAALTTKSKASTNDKTLKMLDSSLNIISEESGIEREELKDSSIVLADVGIDSLLSLMITSRFRDELDIEVDSAILCACPTIKDLEILIANSVGGSIDDIGSEVEADAMHIEEAQEEPVAQTVDLTPATAPIDVARPQPTPVIEVAASEVISNSSSDGLFPQVMDIISEETGVALSDFQDDTQFAEVGMDSLLCLMIGSRLRDELDLELGTDNALFTSSPTVKDLRNAIAPTDISKTGIITPASSEESVDSTVSDLEDIKKDYSSDSSTHEDFVTIPKSTIQKSSAPVRSASSLILQGRPWKATLTLFLFPDGAGSATSYADIPKLHPDIAVIGLNCPYVRHPTEMTVPLDTLMQSYLDEVKRRQPVGPYSFGGWSAGGIMAYRAAQILIEQGETVEKLLLIDSPEPKGLDRLPQRFYEHCKKIGIFGKAMPGKNPDPPAHLYEHFNSTIETLHDYYAKPLTQEHTPDVTIIWAGECVMDGIKFPKMPPGPDDTEGMKFLTEQRTDFTAAGWAEMFPGAEVEVKKVGGAHHFSLMHDPHSKELSQILKAAFGK